MLSCKPIIVLVLLTLPVNALADCAARGYLDDEEPKYKILSCGSAAAHIQRINAERGISEPGPPKKAEEYKADEIVIVFPLPAPIEATKNDKAIEVTAMNNSAKLSMRGKSEVWHFKGSCRSLPLRKIVTLNLDVHCSDVGRTLFWYFGDVTVLSVKRRYD